jgi:hypothetical protein
VHLIEPVSSRHRDGGGVREARRLVPPRGGQRRPLPPSMSSSSFSSSTAQRPRIGSFWHADDGPKTIVFTFAPPPVVPNGDRPIAHRRAVPAAAYNSVEARGPCDAAPAAAHLAQDARSSRGAATPGILPKIGFESVPASR